jgi:hydroxyacyl-ACP dehydratase HTD2-like protein with hotdog domain
MLDAGLPHKGVRFAEVSVDLELPQLLKQPTHSMLFRFSAVTWNTHRIHYDQAYAKTESHPDVLVQATMHGAFLLQMLNAFVRGTGHVKTIDYANRGRAVPGDTLICRGTVTQIDPASRAVICEIEEVNQRGELCAKGTATLVFD